MLNLKKLIFILIVCAGLLISLSCAFASEIDINNIGDADSDVVEVSASPINNQKLESSQSGLSDFDELKIIFENLNDGGYYNIDKDYVLNDKTDNEYSIINITSNYVTIYGNGHL